ncbi:hypothetical protein [Actinocatenispora rupis]|uniref:Excreted virulence factor EspC, type VII ESX diderm n=1 Tax=Actinocatenispora rupis TaxID=519421 RepID=A0A8J3JBN9_9ACTN|nr:hypothetical protein [Actinocatenispora rupis]GID13587.1 hypothetical protein Aru02nite_44760 [Actinocatenispora rupis]
MGHDWSVDLGSTKKIEVDTEHLENITKYLKVLSDSINDDLLPYLDEVNRDVAFGYGGVKMIQGDGGGQASAFGSPNIATIADLGKKVGDAYTAVKESLTAIAGDFDASGSAISSIAEKYKSSDDRNNASMKDFDTAFSAAKSSGTNG